MNTLSSKSISLTSLVALALIGTTVLSGCSQKASTEETAAKEKAPVAVAEKHKEEAAAAPAAPAAATAGKRVAKARPEAQPVQEKPVQKAICANCGEVVSVKMSEEEGKGSGLGAVAGGVAGGLIGHQVGDGTGRDLATIAGAFGGAIVGNKVEKNMKKTKVYDVVVKLENGEERSLHYTTEPGVAAGDKVKIENDVAVKQ